jgi:hypothetical protein
MMHIFREILRTQWKWTWSAVLIAALCAFSVPLLSMQNAVLDEQTLARNYRASPAEHFLSTMDRWGMFYTLTAVLLGLGVAVLVWSADHRGRHVYALVLPIERWRFVLLRFTSGAALLLIPAVTLLVGSLLAVTSVVIPAGLNAYPIALTFRFLLAALVSYSIFFAISSGTTRTAALVLVPMAAIVLCDALLNLVGVRVELVETSILALFEWPGLMEVFTGHWLLVDV